MSVPEILAPAGSPESLLAALRCGADAVYVGGKQFSARQSAANFDLDELKQAADLCHLYGAKLYLTVNTVLLDEEMSAFSEYIESAARIGVDACIVQDVGAAACIRKIVPQMPLHASTQMTIHTPEGAVWAKEHGFSRVVVARELSQKEIQPIIACGIEVEQFVHGALCMSVSGQCYLSALIGSRSANRGRCAQACRLPFSARGKSGVCSLSLKDLSLVEHMQELIHDGVASLKIEGRMKRPEYVAAAVTALRQARSGEKPDLESLRAVFSRSGFTDGYYTGLRRELFGVREKEDVTAAKTVLPQLEQLYQKPSHPVPLDLHVTLEGGQPVTLTAADDDGSSVTVCGEIPQPALKKATDTEQLERQLSKLGDTIYYLRQISCSCDGQHMLPASALNALRRKCTAEMDRMRIQKNTPRYEINPDTSRKQETGFQGKKTPVRRIRVRSQVQLNVLDLQPGEECIIPLHLAQKISHQEQYLLQAPRFVTDEQHLTEELTQLRWKGWKHLVCENPAHIRIGKALDFVLHGGMDLHTTNSMSADFYYEDGLADLMLSPELTLRQSAALKSSIPVGIYAYGKLPVMLMRCCPIQNETGCKSCTKHLTDRTRRNFPVLCQKQKEYTELCNAVPVWMADRLEALSHADFLLLDFTDESSPKEICSIMKAYRYGCAETPPQITRGLLYRGIQG